MIQIVNFLFRGKKDFFIENKLSINLIILKSNIPIFFDYELNLKIVGNTKF